MQHLNCPACGYRFDLLQAAEDENGRAFMAVLARQVGTVGRELIHYLSLFKPRTQVVSWGRLLGLAEDVERLTEGLDAAVVAQALRETIEAMRTKRHAGDWKPLGNHNYLRRVLESVQARGVITPVTGSSATPGAPLSRTAQAIAALQAHSGPTGVHERFARDVCDSLADWLLLSLEGQPSADLITAVADKWIEELWQARDWSDPQYGGRLKPAFAHAAKGATRWPRSADVLSHIPRFGVRS